MAAQAPTPSATPTASPARPASASICPDTTAQDHRRLGQRHPANRLVGGPGKDVLTGGAGNDVFDFDAITETGITSAAWDVITDFVRGQDQIDLSTIDANTATASINDAFIAIFLTSAAAFSAAGQLNLVGNVLYGNTDTDSSAEFAIQLTGIGTLTIADFVV
jgi:Ca2+-binding RTX toxin-like protein